jgi:Fur family ferric uptake transcriptional regulator
MILEELFAADAPVSAERIAERLADRGTTFDLTSIYRNLERLEAMGVVRHVHLGHGPGLYSLLGQGEREYLVCERCGTVVSVEPRQLDPAREAVRSRFGYEARFSHFPLMGLCPDCAS